MHESLDGFEFRQIATELLPLIDVRIEFLLNILKTNRPINFCIVNRCFSQIGKRVTALD